MMSPHAMPWFTHRYLIPFFREVCQNRSLSLFCCAKQIKLQSLEFALSGRANAFWICFYFHVRHFFAANRIGQCFCDYIQKRLALKSRLLKQKANCPHKHQQYLWCKNVVKTICQLHYVPGWEYSSSRANGTIKETLPWGPLIQKNKIHQLVGSTCSFVEGEFVLGWDLAKRQGWGFDVTDDVGPKTSLMWCDRGKFHGDQDPARECERMLAIFWD